MRDFYTEEKLQYIVFSKPTFNFLDEYLVDSIIKTNMNKGERINNTLSCCTVHDLGSVEA